MNCQFMFCFHVKTRDFEREGRFFTGVLKMQVQRKHTNAVEKYRPNWKTDNTHGSCKYQLKLPLDDLINNLPDQYINFVMNKFQQLIYTKQSKLKL